MLELIQTEKRVIVILGLVGILLFMIAKEPLSSVGTELIGAAVTTVIMWLAIDRPKEAVDSDQMQALQGQIAELEKMMRSMEQKMD